MSQDLSSLPAAIIGTGFMCWVHAEALVRIGVPLRGVLGSSPEKSKRQAQQLPGIQRAYDNFEQLLKRLIPYVTMGKRLCNQPPGTNVSGSEL